MNLGLIDPIPSSPESPDSPAQQPILDTNTEHFMIKTEPLIPLAASNKGSR